MSYDIRLRDIQVGEHLADSKFDSDTEREVTARNNRCETFEAGLGATGQCRMVWQRVFKLGSKVDPVTGFPEDERLHLCWRHSGVFESELAMRSVGPRG